jgi:hypothetical protein
MNFCASGNILFSILGIGSIWLICTRCSAPGLRVRQRVDAAADEQIAEHLACARVLRHLVDAELVRAGAVLEEEVVEQVEDEVAAGEDVAAVPVVGDRVAAHGAQAGADEVHAVAGAVLAHAQRRAGDVGGGGGLAGGGPVSSELIVAATTSMCPYSSAAMFAISA